MKKFRTLELAIEFHQQVESLIEEKKIIGHMRDQLIRASSSVSLNLSEGNAKATTKEKKRFYQIAYGSIQECRTIFRLIRCENEDVADTADKLGAWIYKLTALLD